MIDLARIGGPVACLGLALLLVATTRRDRIAGLWFAAFGSCLLGAAIVPHRPLEIVGGSLALLVVSAGLAALFVRVPWLFPVLALACVPARLGVHVGGASSKLLVPLLAHSATLQPCSLHTHFPELSYVCHAHWLCLCGEISTGVQ